MPERLVTVINWVSAAFIIGAVLRLSDCSTCDEGPLPRAGGGSSDVVSPDGLYIAQLRGRYCNLGIAGASGQRIVTLRRASESFSEVVFRAWHDRPDSDVIGLSWNGPADLTIVMREPTTGSTLQIVRQRSKLGKVKIAYETEVY